MVQIQRFSDFLKEPVQMVCSNPKFKVVSKLSENHKINVIGSTEVKFYGRSKMLYLTLGPLHFESTRVGSVTRVLMVQIQRFMVF